MVMPAKAVRFYHTSQWKEIPSLDSPLSAVNLYNILLINRRERERERERERALLKCQKIWRHAKLRGIRGVKTAKITDAVSCRHCRQYDYLTIFIHDKITSSDNLLSY